MTLFEERIIPRLEEIRTCFETPDYPYTGLNSNGNFGLDVLENDQVKTICTIKDNFSCIVCRERTQTISLSFISDEDRIFIDYDFSQDNCQTEIIGISEFCNQIGIQLSDGHLKYLTEFYQYLQSKLVQYENSSN